MVCRVKAWTRGIDEEALRAKNDKGEEPVETKRTS
jgi:hypothetical protein